ncbi:hypothetical protein FB451DRAFT_1180032 [Mycena latifolia]|nr:hypothetical protein FB451DRAFT_1180032 [Mycena latifolia]
MHFRGLFVILSAAGASLAASLPRGNFPPVNVAKSIDAASYNGTVVSADLSSPGVNIFLDNSISSLPHQFFMISHINQPNPCPNRAIWSSGGKIAFHEAQRAFYEYLEAHRSQIDHFTVPKTVVPRKKIPAWRPNQPTDTWSTIHGSAPPCDALQKRDAGNVYLCTAANWEQYCVYITDAGPGEDIDCTGSEVGPIRAPGISDLSQPINLGEGGGGALLQRRSVVLCVLVLILAELK